MRQNGSTQLPVDTSRWVDLAARAICLVADGANTSRWVDLAPGSGQDNLSWLPEPSLQPELTILDGSTWSIERTNLDKLMCQNWSTQLPVDTSRWVDLAARANTFSQVNFAAGANTSRQVEFAAGEDKSRWVDKATRAESESREV